MTLSHSNLVPESVLRAFSLFMTFMLMCVMWDMSVVSCVMHCMVSLLMWEWLIIKGNVRIKDGSMSIGFTE